MTRTYKIVVYAPVESADILREAIGKAGAGMVGEYDFCSFSTKGIGRFRPSENAVPAIGQTNVLEEVEEEKIETVCSAEKIKDVLQVIRDVHPYEEPATQVYSLENLEDLK